MGEKIVLGAKPYREHLNSSKSLVTPYKEIRAGFIALSLEKNRKATPFVEEAKALKSYAAKAKNPKQLLKIKEIKKSILTAAGISDKAANHLNEGDQLEAVQGLIDNFLEPAGIDFVDELVYRFLLTRGDSLGGSLRNLAGVLGERKFSRSLISALSIEGKEYSWMHSKSRKWIKCSGDDADIEIHLKGIHWKNGKGSRTLIYNLTVPFVEKNVDLCLFNVPPNEMIFGKRKKSCHRDPKTYIALGELKGGIDPAGADEHWKTANSALERIRKSFKKKGRKPQTFFVGAAIEKAMAVEIFNQLSNGTMSNAANLTNENQVISLCKWFIGL
ncbi:MAG: AvaI/BsoBI family type II restriction endonuclease [Waddliaceae bacterium]